MVNSANEPQLLSVNETPALVHLCLKLKDVVFLNIAKIELREGKLGNGNLRGWGLSDS